MLHVTCFISFLVFLVAPFKGEGDNGPSHYGLSGNNCLVFCRVRTEVIDHHVGQIALLDVLLCTLNTKTANRLSCRHLRYDPGGMFVFTEADSCCNHSVCLFCSFEIGVWSAACHTIKFRNRVTVRKRIMFSALIVSNNRVKLRPRNIFPIVQLFEIPPPRITDYLCTAHQQLLATSLRHNARIPWGVFTLVNFSSSKGKRESHFCGKNNFQLREEPQNERRR